VFEIKSHQKWIVTVIGDCGCVVHILNNYSALSIKLARTRAAKDWCRRGEITQLSSELVFVATAPHWARAFSFAWFLDHTQRRTTVGTTPLDEWSARRRDLYPITHNTHNRQTSMPPVEFIPTIPADERQQTYALDREATGTGI